MTAQDEHHQAAEAGSHTDSISIHKLPTTNEPAQKELSVEFIPDPVENEEVHSVFTVTSKRWLIATASLASFFSPLSSAIYYPALDKIAKELNVSSSKIALTVTTYLVSSSPLNTDQELNSPFL